MKVRALIVDDEPPARATLRELLADVDWITCIGEARDGRQAVDLINRLDPDLVFLDVHMPERDGLEVVRCLRRAPQVVFTTAWDQYAVEAFELQAADYLLKPFGRRRLQQALTRTQEVFAADRDRGFLRRLFVREQGRIVPLRVETIEHFGADSGYVEAHACGRRYLTSIPLKELERSLDPERFARVHRSFIVNLDYVRGFRPIAGRRLLVELQGGNEVAASRRFSARLRDRLAQAGPAVPRRNLS